MTTRPCASEAGASDLALDHEARRSLALHSAGVGLWSVDLASGRIWATDEARAHFGFGREENLTLKHLETALHPADLDRVRQAIDGCLRVYEPLDIEYRIQGAKDGEVRWLESRGRVRLGIDGTPEQLNGCSLDITRRTALADAAADLAGLGFYEVDFEQRSMSYDERTRELCGFAPDGPLEIESLRLWLERLHPEDRDRVLDLRERLHGGEFERLSCTYRYLHPTRGELWLHHAARVSERASDERAVRTFGVLRDITEQKQTELKLSEMGRRLIQAHEEERARLARDLHDDLTQRVAVLSIEFSQAELLERGEEQVAAMHSVRECLIRLSEDIHSLAYQLHPSVLEELGLPEALRTECERFSREGRIDITLDTGTLHYSIGKDAALCLFRIAQEALNNVKRHAGSCRVLVILKEMEEGLLLAVRDDGVGFDFATASQKTSLGLASMRERVEILRGSLDIESAPGEGTSITAWVPTA